MAQGAPTRPPPLETETPSAGDAGDDRDPALRTQETPEVPRGPATLSVHVPRGARMPLILSGQVVTIRPPSGQIGLAAWAEIELQTASPEPQSFFLLKQPDSLALPFTPGDRISAEIDCRKGGWHRVCDAIVRNERRQVVMIIAASGDSRLAAGWTIEQGPVAVSEIQAAQEKSVRHTHALVISREGRSLTIAPNEWHRFELRGERWLVQGQAVVWEGLRPPESVDFRAFSLVRER